MTLTERIENIVSGHSGGIKFNDLLIELLALNLDYDSGHDQGDSFIARVEATALSNAKLSVLYYSWDMGSQLRQKMFVYEKHR